MENLVSSESIACQVWEAAEGVDDYTHLPLGVPVLLEVLSEDYDGIFETPGHFHRVISRNFVSDGYLVETVPAGFVKKWSRPESEYKHLFAQRVGADSWLPVLAGDIELTYTYELFYGRNHSKPVSIELFVTANFKKSI